MKKIAATLTLLTALTIGGHRAAKTEDHPKEKEQTSGASQNTITMEELAGAIEHFIARDSALKGGYFLVYDPIAKTTLALTMQGVHKHRLSKVSEGIYFACVDFKTPKDKSYDVDIFMTHYAELFTKGADAGSLQPAEITIHKEAGKARYHWTQENGFWKKKPIEK
ncbi:MAG: hypothetical protein HY547_04835 [Elusimicrobia bacterium]|nr:hypothetical protein [Elusimicrobiota bacterium]